MTLAPTGHLCPSGGGAFLAELDGALGQTDPRQRDEALAVLESCESEAPLVRALRAELAPAGCADLLVAPWLDTWASSEPTAEVHSALVGLGLAARLNRLVQQAPRLEPPFDEPQFREFLRTTLARWIVDQAHAIHQTALEGARLHGYGKGIVAIAAGLADMRFVDVVREVPLPESLAADAELREEYYLSLEQSLEPRIVRGRDAALVGLRRFAELGILTDSRLEQARILLSRLFAGRRIDSLDGLALPPLDTPSLDTPTRRLAARLPPFYAARWLKALSLSDAANLRALLERGLSPSQLREAEKTATDPALLRLVFRAHLATGQRYWQSEAFESAARVASRVPTGDPLYAEAELVRAIARALHGGPSDAAQMMARGPFLPQSVGDVSALDSLSESKTATSPLATFNAALILALVPQSSSAPEFWANVAARFDRAQMQAPGTDLASEAKLRRDAALAIGAAIAEHQRQNAAEAQPPVPTPRAAQPHKSSASGTAASKQTPPVPPKH